MHNDSLETLLLRHYGNTAPTPPALESRLVASVRQEAELQSQGHNIAQRLRTYRINRRRAVQLVAIASSGLGLLSLGMESLQGLEVAMLGQDIARQQQALP
jgi:hypothetical protein